MGQEARSHVTELEIVVMRSALHRRLFALSRTAVAGFIITGALAAHAARFTALSCCNDARKPASNLN